MTDKPTYDWVCPWCGKQYQVISGKVAPSRCPKCAKSAADCTRLNSLFAVERAAASKVAQPTEPGKFVRFVPPPVEPSRSLQERSARDRKQPSLLLLLSCMAGAIVVCLGVVFVVEACRVHVAPFSGRVATKAKPREPSDSKVYFTTTEMLRKHLLRPKSAKFADDWKVQRMSIAGNGTISYRVSGVVWAENRAGVGSNGNWWARVYWKPEDDRVVAEMIYLDDEAVYLSDDAKAAVRVVAEYFGNEYSGLPEDVAREIRNVQAAVEDAIKNHNILRAFSFQWPDDPARREPKIHLNHAGEWEVTGKLEWYDGRPRSELFAICRRQPLGVVKLRIDKRWQIGRP